MTATAAGTPSSYSSSGSPEIPRAVSERPGSRTACGAFTRMLAISAAEPKGTSGWRPIRPIEGCEAHSEPRPATGGRLAGPPSPSEGLVVGPRPARSPS